MIWLGVLCLLLAAALAGYVAATERQMWALADALAVRGRDLSAGAAAVSHEGGAGLGPGGQRAHRRG